MANDFEVKPNGFEVGLTEFAVEPIFEERTYERFLFTFSLDEREYKGHFHDGEIQWLNPHPKQDLGEVQLKSLEAQIYELMEQHGIKDETDDIEIKPMFDDRTHEGHIFKLTIQGNEYTGALRGGQIQWLDPKPRRKLKENRVERIEEKIHKKMKEKNLE